VGTGFLRSLRSPVATAPCLSRPREWLSYISHPGPSGDGPGTRGRACRPLASPGTLWRRRIPAVGTLARPDLFDLVVSLPGGGCQPERTHDSPGHARAREERVPTLGGHVKTAPREVVNNPRRESARRVARAQALPQLSVPAVSDARRTAPATRHDPAGTPRRTPVRRCLVRGGVTPDAPGDAVPTWPPGYA
jgi:hypothetical protein